jgi:hypothetical protein
LQTARAGVSRDENNLFDDFDGFGELVIFGGIAIAAQDKDTLKLGKLSFSDFRGYENWKNVAVSQTENS